jgi:uracil-DNA glycosylase
VWVWAGVGVGLGGDGVGVSGTGALAGLVERGLVAPDWADALAPVDGRISAMGAFLRDEIRAGRGYLPHGDHVFRAFSRPLSDVRVLVVGQDPYPTPGHPVGLSFSVAADVRPLPKSLVNIYRELTTDIGCEPPTTGDLTRWSEQGVMLLNRVLTVAPGAPASHRGRGWEAVTERAIETLAQRGGPMAAILWGRDAQSLKPVLGDIPWVESVHPSPLSASRGFFGSRPFSRVNALLEQQGGEPVDWRLA